MEALNVILDLEQQGFRDDPYGVVEYEGPLTIGGMAEGTETGKPVVMVAIDDPDGSDTVLVMQTTLSLFLTAADALKAKYGDPRS